MNPTLSLSTETTSEEEKRTNMDIVRTIKEEKRRGRAIEKTTRTQVSRLYK
jgi:hypothetical protein